MSLQEITLWIILPILSCSLLIVLVRLVRGPSLADRVIALDLLTTLGIGIVSAYAIATNQPVFIDVAIIIALVSFIGTVAFAYYLEKNP